MPFELRIDRIARRGDEVAVTGRLLRGFYAGQEFVLVPDVEGKVWRVPVSSHAMEYLGNAEWPITAREPTLLTLYLPLPREARVDASRPLVGIGNEASRGEAEDYHAHLDDPRFWSVLWHETIRTEAGDEDYELLSITAAEATAFFERMLSGIAEGRMPTLRFEIDTNWALIWTATKGAEYRHTLVLDDRARRREITLGWTSGHFANPALRPRELAEIAKRLAAAGYAPHHALIFAEFCGGDGSGTLSPGLHRDHFAALFNAVPGADEKRAEVLYRNFCASTFAKSPNWRFDETLGWVNNYMRSRRNPNALGCLSTDEFATVLTFFGR